MKYNAAGKLIAHVQTTAGGYVNYGVPCDPLTEAVLINNAAAANTDFNAGFAFRNGCLQGTALETAVPAGSSYVNGLAIKAGTGALYYNITLPVAGWCNGLPIAANGTVCVALI